jgi:hypothetical protein
MRLWTAVTAAWLLLPVPLFGAMAAVPAPSPPAPSLDAAALARAAERAGLRRGVLLRALAARARVLAGGLAARPVLTVIDYSLPSRARRLWVLDLVRARVLAHELVAHGRGSGDDLARRFSNQPGSLQSSLGTFLTGTTYYGKHGLSLRLQGLDPGVNDRAAERAIVVHGAPYVDAALVPRLGRLGRSQGCPALSPAVAARIIDLIRGGSVLYAYYHT